MGPRWCHLEREGTAAAENTVSGHHRSGCPGLQGPLVSGGARGYGWVVGQVEGGCRPHSCSGDTPMLTGGQRLREGGPVSQRVRSWDPPCLTCWGSGHTAVGDTGWRGNLAGTDPGPAADSCVTPGRSRKPSGLSFRLCTEGHGNSPLPWRGKGVK